MRKGKKVAKHWFFQWFVAPEGRKVGSLKRRVRSHLARWEMKKCIVARSTVSEKAKKHCTFGALFEVAMSKKCTPLWREARFQVKMHKTLEERTPFGSCDVEKVHAVVARSTFPSQNVQNTRGSDHFWRFRCRLASIHYTTGHYTTLHSSTLHYTTLHSSTLHYIKLHYTTLHYTEWHCNTDRQVDS